MISGTVIGDPDEVVAGTVGRPRAEVDLRIVDEAGAALPAGEVGEVVCRSPAMMRGYWRDPDLTAAAIDADGWLHTGDLGRLRPDGNLVLVGPAARRCTSGAGTTCTPPRWRPCSPSTPASPGPR